MSSSGGCGGIWGRFSSRKSTSIFLSSSSRQWCQSKVPEKISFTDMRQWLDWSIWLGHFRDFTYRFRDVILKQLRCQPSQPIRHLCPLFMCSLPLLTPFSPLNYCPSPNLNSIEGTNLVSDGPFYFVFLPGDEKRERTPEWTGPWQVSLHSLWLALNFSLPTCNLHEAN